MTPIEDGRLAVRAALESGTEPARCAYHHPDRPSPKCPQCANYGWIGRPDDPKPCPNAQHRDAEPVQETPAEHFSKCGPFCEHVEHCPKCKDIYGYCGNHKNPSDNITWRQEPTPSAPAPKTFTVEDLTRALTAEGYGCGSLVHEECLASCLTARVIRALGLGEP